MVMQKNTISLPGQLRQCSLFSRAATPLLVAALLIAALIFASCKQTEQEAGQTPKSVTGIQKTYDRGPVKCRIDVDKSEITIAERINLTITVDIDETYEVDLPPTGEKLAEFGIVDYHTTMPSLSTDGRKTISRSYVLEPFLSGDYTIPAMTVSFWKSGEKEETVHTIETEALSVLVKSLLPETFQDMKIHDIRQPVSLPQSMAIWIWSAAISGALIMLGLLGFYIYRKRRNAAIIEAENFIPAHEIAFADLERLVAENYIEKGHIKPFYHGVSNILRQYIENRFNINAPEQTTEEFLAGLETNNAFPVNFKELLKDFLRHCDLVKFAAHQPTTNDIQNTFDSCKTFIIETKPLEKDKT
jgi:hypothetical protein